MPGLLHVPIHHHIKCVSNKAVHDSNYDFYDFVEPYNPNDFVSKVFD